MFAEALAAPSLVPANAQIVMGLAKSKPQVGYSDHSCRWVSAILFIQFAGVEDGMTVRAQNAGDAPASAKGQTGNLFSEDQCCRGSSRLIALQGCQQRSDSYDSDPLLGGVYHLSRSGYGAEWDTIHDFSKRQLNWGVEADFKLQVSYE